MMVKPGTTGTPLLYWWTMKETGTTPLHHSSFSSTPVVADGLYHVYRFAISGCAACERLTSLQLFPFVSGNGAGKWFWVNWIRLYKAPTVPVHPQCGLLPPGSLER